MKKNEVRLNRLYAVNNLPNGQIYRVVEIDGFMVRLEYRLSPKGESYAGGWMDISVLRKPTKKQLKNAFPYDD